MQSFDQIPSLQYAYFQPRLTTSIAVTANKSSQAEASDGTIGTLEGKVCNFPCKDMSAGEPISTQGCQFPSQVTDGYFDPTIPTGEESDCFE